MKLHAAQKETQTFEYILGVAMVDLEINFVLLYCSTKV